MPRRNLWIGFALAGALLGVTLSIWWNTQSSQTRNGKFVPPWGLRINPHGLEKTNPERAEAMMRRIYTAMLQYREATGVLPDAPVFLVQAGEEGLISEHLTAEDWINPDYIYTDRFATSGLPPTGLQGDSFFPAYRRPRPDGTPRPAFPKPGERELWLVCDDYERMNQVARKDRDATNPEGFLILLWSDGEIERQPMGAQVICPGGEVGYPGEAGLPKGCQRLDMVMSSGR